MTSGIVESIKAIEVLESMELSRKVNQKTSEVIDAVDVSEITEDPMFKKMLAAAMAAKAAGVAFNVS